MKRDPEKFRASMHAAIDKYVKQQARNTISENAERDRGCAGYARIPDDDACDFCVTMGATNGFYRTRESAGGGAEHGTADDKYHPYCNCRVCMIFDDEGRLRARDPQTGEAIDYDGTEMVRRYREAEELRGAGNYGRKGKKAAQAKAVKTDSTSAQIIKASETRPINPDSIFLEELSPDDFYELIEMRFGCTVSKGFKKISMNIAQPLMADLECAFADFPEARAKLREIVLGVNMPSNEAIKCLPLRAGGDYQLAFNRDFFNDIESVKARYANSVAKGQHVAGSSWPSLAYHDGCHGVEAYLCGEKYGISANEFAAAWDSCEIATEIIDEAYTRIRSKTPGIASLNELLSEISGYAEEDRSEALCEALLDFRINSSKSSLLVKEIVEIIKERFHGIR